MSTPSLQMTPTAYKEGKLYSVLPTSGVGDFTVSRNSKATRVNQDGFIEEVDENVPRLDYTDGGCPVLLTEPQSTNLITYSENFGDSYWDKGSNTTVTVGSLSPDGSNNAFNVVMPNTIGTYISREFTGLSGDYTISFYAKSDTTSQINAYNPTGTTTTINLSSEWTRYELSGNVTGNFNVGVDNHTTEMDIDLYGFQLEEGSYATSYIPTNGSAVTRLADAVSGAGNENIFNSEEGVLYAEMSALANIYSSASVFSISNGTISNRIFIGFLNTTENQVSINLTSGATTFVSETYTLTDSADFFKIGVSYQLNSVKLYINGILINEDLTATMPIGLSKLSFDSGQGGSPFYGKIKDLQVFNRALTDTELQQLTS